MKKPTLEDYKMPLTERGDFGYTKPTTSQLEYVNTYAGQIGAAIQKAMNVTDANGKYTALQIKVLKNGYEVDGFVFHTVLQLSHWLSQNLVGVNSVESQEV